MRTRASRFVADDRQPGVPTPRDGQLPSVRPARGARIALLRPDAFAGRRLPERRCGTLAERQCRPRTPATSIDPSRAPPRRYGASRWCPQPALPHQHDALAFDASAARRRVQMPDPGPERRDLPLRAVFTPAGGSMGRPTDQCATLVAQSGAPPASSQPRSSSWPAAADAEALPAPPPAEASRARVFSGRADDVRPWRADASPGPAPGQSTRCLPGAPRHASHPRRKATNSFGDARARRGAGHRRGRLDRQKRHRGARFCARGPSAPARRRSGRQMLRRPSRRRRSAAVVATAGSRNYAGQRRGARRSEVATRWSSRRSNGAARRH